MKDMTSKCGCDEAIRTLEYEAGMREEANNAMAALLAHARDTIRAHVAKYEPRLVRRVVPDLVDLLKQLDDSVDVRTFDSSIGAFRAVVGQRDACSKALQTEADARGIPGPSVKVHADGYDGPCFCRTCLSYGDQ